MNALLFIRCESVYEVDVSKGEIIDDLPRDLFSLKATSEAVATFARSLFENDADDVETAQSSHQLTEDKKDVALETELETRTPSSTIIVKTRAVHKEPEVRRFLIVIVLLTEDAPSKAFLRVVPCFLGKAQTVRW
uniref:Uncharacterized protein n=1 Tax=Parascaris equorum TaxID=6256 RepID=A0A914S2I3_PAREQ